MRIKTICTALAALILAACNSEIVEDHSDYDEYWYDLTVGLPDSRTKVSEKNSPGTPNAVNTLQVLVFDDGSRYFFYDYFSSIADDQALDSGGWVPLL